ncbi:MAG TPA: DUF4148 domain-containing protein [Aquabacterium sp.]|nr:DUF4148 domain-containing protein [Aquabacterium sp.]
MRTLRTLSLSLLTVASVLGSQAVLADTADHHTVTREEVKAEFQRARAAGELDYAYEVMGGATGTVRATPAQQAQTKASTPATQAAKH